MSSFFTKIGGRPALDRINKIFYDHVYAHPWIGLYFKDVPQEVIEEQQGDFLQAAFGGPNNYCGKLPIPAHKHILITSELFDLRKELLTKSLQEFGLAEEHIAHWLEVDEAFRKVLIKKSIDDCEKRFASDKILNFPKK